MNFIKNTLLVLVFSTCYLSFAQSKSTIKFYQNEKLLPISKNNEISLKKQAFSLTYFYKKYMEESKALYALQVSFFKNKEDLALLKIGTPINELANFYKGSGMASPTDGFYDLMAIGSKVHNYLYYATEKDHNVELIQNLRNDFEGRWLINDYIDTDNNTEGKLSKLKEKVLYMAAFRDGNLNGILDEGELETYTLKFF